MIRTGSCLLFAVLALAPPAPGGSHSAPLARQLSQVLASRHLDAIAAADPTAPDRFVGALLFPDVQLLVVAGRLAPPDAARAQLAARQYKDVYLALSASSAPDSRVFFQDLKADGLHATAGEGVDVMYEHVTKQTIFDGKPDKTQFTAADNEYARLLSLLVAEANAPSGTRAP